MKVIGANVDRRYNSSKVIYAIIAILLVLFVVLGSLFYVQSQLSILLHTIQVNEQIETNLTDFQAGINNAETGQRGYLLTSNTDYLEPYNLATATTNDYLTNTIALVQSESQPVGDLHKLERLANDKLAELKTTIDLHDKGKKAEAIALVNTDFGKLKTDSIQKLVAKFNLGRRELKDTRNEDLAQLLRLNKTVVFASVGLLIALLTYVLIQVRPVFNKVNEQNKELQRQHGILKIKNRELEHFAYITSHDLKEPLRTLNGFMTVFEEDYRDKFDQEGKQLFTYIRKASQRMNEMIEAILKFSKLGTTEGFERVNLNELVREVCENIDFAIEESKAEIVIADLPEITAKESLIKLVFQNLLANALKFKRDGVVPRITVSAVEKNRFWEFTVADNGIGIPPQKTGEIFNFFTKLHLSSKYEGQGIGLAFCQKIVDIHGGVITVQSQLDKGSSFTFSIAKDLQNEHA